LVLNEDESQVLHRLFSVGETRVKVVLGFRPESVTRTDISPAAVEESAGNTGLEFGSNVFEVDRLGESTLAHLQFDDVESQGESSGSLVVRLPAESEVEPGDRLRLEIDRGKILLFDPESGQNLLKEIK
jgi:multiple sugar transport system ATP-binding protein